MKIPLKQLGLIVGLVLAAGCSRKEPEPAPTSEPKAAVSTTVSAVKPIPAHPPVTPPANAQTAPSSLGVSWEDPADWKRVAPRSPMRKASYQILPAPGDPEAAELNVFYFGASQGGSIEDNMQRWEGQFQDVKPGDSVRAERKVGQLTVHTIRIKSGSMGPGMMPGQAGGAKSGYGLMGALVEAPSGKYFFKMTGPAKTVSSAEVSFNKLLESLKADGK